MRSEKLGILSVLVAAVFAACSTGPSSGSSDETDGGSLSASLDSGVSTDSGLKNRGSVDAAVAVTDSAAPFDGTDILIYRGGGGVVGNEWDFTNWQGAVTGRNVVDTTGPLPSLDAFALVALIGPGAGNSGVGIASEEMTAITAWVKRGGTLLFDTDRDDTYGGFDLSAANTYITNALATLGVDISVQGPVQLSGFFSLPLDASNPLGAAVGTLSCGDAPILTLGSNATRIDTMATGAQAYYASAPLGSGRVAVLADTTCVIDYSTTAAPSTPLGHFLTDLTTAR